jgi:hypothetical protein
MKAPHTLFECSLLIVCRLAEEGSEETFLWRIEDQAPFSTPFVGGQLPIGPLRSTVPKDDGHREAAARKTARVALRRCRLSRRPHASRARYGHRSQRRRRVFWWPGSRHPAQRSTFSARYSRVYGVRVNDVATFRGIPREAMQARWLRSRCDGQARWDGHRGRLFQILDRRARSMAPIARPAQSGTILRPILRRELSPGQRRLLKQRPRSDIRRQALRKAPFDWPV